MSEKDEKRELKSAALRSIFFCLLFGIAGRMFFQNNMQTCDYDPAIAVVAGVGYTAFAFGQCVGFQNDYHGSHQFGVTLIPAIFIVPLAVGVTLIGDTVLKLLAPIALKTFGVMNAWVVCELYSH